MAESSELISMTFASLIAAVGAVTSQSCARKQLAVKFSPHCLDTSPEAGCVVRSACSSVDFVDHTLNSGPPLPMY
jgi:hypothetical protein